MSLLIYGIIILMTGIMAMYLYNTSKKLNKKICWYEWLILSLGVISVLFSVEILFDSIAEREPQAAFMGFTMFVLIGFLLLVLFGRMFSKKISSSKKHSVE